MKRIIVTRFSAMGDVAMVASVIKEFLEIHRDVEIIMVSRPFFKSFFTAIPRVIFHDFHPQGIHKYPWGLFKLFRELQQYKAWLVADLHNNIRSRILDSYFTLADYKVKILNKGRAEKKKLTRPRAKQLVQLRPTTERYADVFRALGFPFSLAHTLQKEDMPYSEKVDALLQKKSKKIGIAPFAQHTFKVFPFPKMQQLITALLKENFEIYVFGGGNREQALVDLWTAGHDQAHNTIGQLSLTEELALIAKLDLMVSMDSAGMHMASLVGTRCLSLWGATHPYAGFLGYGQSLDDCIQVDHPNRPSSIYGNKPCDCDGIEAINLITSEMVLTKIKNVCA